MSMACERHSLVLPFVMLNYDELSETMVVGGWGWFIAINVVRIGTGFFSLVNKAPISASMDDAITLRMMENST